MYPANFIIIMFCPIATNFEDRWWPLLTIWIQMRPNKTCDLIWERNC